MNIYSALGGIAKENIGKVLGGTMLPAAGRTRTTNWNLVRSEESRP
jgi:hypothetical protein